ncbi:response regulator [Desulfovibrio sp. ZJ369]|uniref:response regulator n=1 Tax=Desulfovibrio sp. ZJ369 TaxID=2709793 RepID=UPI0013ED9411|nr:response regulator [Desulfovibrio sp. ZJ369]
MPLDHAQKAKQNSYEDTVINYMSKENGHVIVLSDDQAFSTQLRLTLAKELGLSSPNMLTALLDPHQLLRVLREVTPRHPTPILFLERKMGGQDLSFLVNQIKQAYTKLRIIVLTTDVQRDRLMLLHEVGADNFIAKPVSANTLIEKMAFTLKPQSKLGQAIDKAKELLAQKRYPEALAACQKILEFKPDSSAAYLVIGDTQRALREYDKARVAYETAASSAELYLAPLQRLAEMYGELGDKAMQLRYLQKLDSISPLNVNRKVSLGEIHLSMGESEKAEELFDKAVAQVTKDAMAGISSLSGRIAAIYADHDPAKAEKFLRNSLQVKGKFLSKSDIALFNQLGISLRKQGRWKDAISEYKRAIKIAPDDENLYYNVGMAFAEGADFLQAKANLLKALELNPDVPRASPTIAYNFGAVFLQSKERARAAQYFQLALELRPDFQAARDGLKRARG